MSRPAYADNLTRRVVEALGQAIVTGTWDAAGAFPIEAELCARFGVSRSVVREAVKMLTAKGLLSARPRRGTVVEPEPHWNLLDPDVLRWLLQRAPSPELLAEFTQMRLGIEPQAAAQAALAVRGGQAEVLQPIRAALARMQAAGAGADDPLASDIAFHVAILHASGNRFLVQLRELVDTALRISIRLTNARKGVSLASVDDHARVLRAIEAADAPAAAAAMRELLGEALELIQAERGH